MFNWNLFAWIHHYILLACNFVNFSFHSHQKKPSNNMLVVNCTIPKIAFLFGEQYLCAEASFHWRRRANYTHFFPVGVQWHRISNLKSAMMGVFTPWKWASVTNPVFVFVFLLGELVVKHSPASCLGVWQFSELCRENIHAKTKKEKVCGLCHRAPKRHCWALDLYGVVREALALESGRSEFESGIASLILWIGKCPLSFPTYWIRMTKYSL